jgi:hypothetical protein
MTSNEQPTAPFDREREDVSNIVLIEHVNLQQTDQQLATLFYVSGLLLTRDPYLMVGLDNMWINIGRTQMHLPTRGSQAQRLRGTIGLVVPDLDRLEVALRSVQTRLAGTRFNFERHAERIDAVCPWGNRFRCHLPDGDRWGPTRLGIVYVELDVPAGCARSIAGFYIEMFGVPAKIEQNADGLQTATVRVGADQQRLCFVESQGPIPVYDGHHIQIYVADFSGPYRRLMARNLISRETDAHEWRFVDIIDLSTGDTVYQLEHEVRSLRHPLFGRAFVNRNPAQTNSAYARGQDDLRGLF